MNDSDPWGFHNGDDWNSWGGAHIINGTLQDPAVYVSLALAYGGVASGLFGATVGFGKLAIYHIGSKAVYVCLIIPNCANMIGAGNSNLTVLGSSPRYIEIGNELNANYLAVPDAIYTWDLNVEYILNIKTPVFLTNPWWTKVSPFNSEVQLLLMQGFKNFFNILLYPPK